VIWPVVFITTDLINEYFGKPGVKRISYFTAALIAYAFVVVFITMRLAPADFWMDTNNKDAQGNYFNMDFSVVKRVSVGERVKLELKTTLINALNHPNFIFGNQNFDSTSFGLITSQSGNQRIIHFTGTMNF